MTTASKWLIACMCFLCIGGAIYQYYTLKWLESQILKVDKEATARFQKLDSARAIIEVRTTTRTIKLKQEDVKDDKIDQAQRKILDSLNFDPDQLPNF